MIISFLINIIIISSVYNYLNGNSYLCIFYLCRFQGIIALNLF